MKKMILILVFIGMFSPLHADFISGVKVEGGMVLALEHGFIDYTKLGSNLFNSCPEHDWGTGLDEKKVKFTKIKEDGEKTIIYFRITWGFMDNWGLFSSGRYIKHSEMRKAILTDYGEGLHIISNYKLE